MNRENLAYHEAGHAVAAHMLGCAVRDVTIKESGNELGSVGLGHIPGRDVSMVVSLAGPFAEHLCQGAEPNPGNWEADMQTCLDDMERLTGEADAPVWTSREFR